MLGWIVDDISMVLRKGAFMTKKERVCSVVRGESVDFIPSCFSLHFPIEKAFGEDGVKAHMDFYRQTDTDILKIMNENQVPYCGPFNDYRAYSQIPRMTMKSDFMRNQIDFTKRILDSCKDDPFTIGTLHGVVASGVHPLRKAGLDTETARTFQVEALRNEKKIVIDAFKRISDGMCELARAYIEAGVDGIYYAALGGEDRYYTDEEFHRWVEPFDKQILAAVKEAGGYSILHICKDRLNMSRYSSYSDYFDIVNWGVYEAPFSLTDARKMFKGKTLMGGLANRTGVLVDGSEEEIRKAVRDVMEEAGPDRFILGADCTLATEQDLQRLSVAIDETRRVRR